ncbi:MAG: hypothetical protein QGG54_21190 [Gammaproteobacteria bacterium]|nr:hypothetical protein [Gammaproteobacteria bacterium]
MAGTGWVATVFLFQKTDERSIHINHRRCAVGKTGEELKAEGK